MKMLQPRPSPIVYSKRLNSIGPSLWNALPASVRSIFLSGSLSSSFNLSKSIFSHGS